MASVSPGRAVVSSDNIRIALALYEDEPPQAMVIEISPERAIGLAAELLSVGLRHKARAELTSQDAAA